MLAFDLELVIEGPGPVITIFSFLVKSQNNTKWVRSTWYQFFASGYTPHGNTGHFHDRSPVHRHHAGAQARVTAGVRTGPADSEKPGLIH